MLDGTKVRRAIGLRAVHGKLRAKRSRGEVRNVYINTMHMTMVKSSKCGLVGHGVKNLKIIQS